MDRVVRHLFTPQKSNNHKAKILQCEGIALCIGIVLGAQVLVHRLSVPTGPFPSILGFSSSITSSQVIEQTNQRRASLGLTSLTQNTQLNQAAVAKGNNMCTDQYWAHVSPSGLTPWTFMKNAGYRYSVAGENLARDFSDTGSMVDAWMASPTHKANIVNGKYTEIGVAVIDCNLLGHDTALVVQMFGSQVAGTAQTNTAKKTTQTQALAKASPTPVENAPAIVPTPVALEQIAGQESIPQFLANADPSVVLSTPIPTSLFPPVFSPLQVMKSILGSIVGTLLVLLLIDIHVSHQKKLIRITGKNVAHIVFLSGILIVLIVMKAGVTL